MQSPVQKPEVKSFFDPVTATVTHVVRDPATRKAAIIDPVLDYDPKSGVRSTGSADRVIDWVRAQGLEIEWLLETHIHADHLTGAPYVKSKLGGRLAVGRHIADVQQTWNGIFNYKEGLETDPSLFDHLFDDGDRFRIGELEGEVWYTPGHTAIDLTYIIGDAAFIGDTLFMPDYGTARCDFPGGDARALWRSIQRILSLPAETRLFLCHDYLPKEGRKEHAVVTSVGEQRRNVMLAGLDEETFVARRQERDKGLAVPVLLYPSLQVNIRAGNPPPAEDNGISYIKVPMRDRAGG
jgi:glyoxylase-like metal-dependent hydrolase (beta-lactamase superfamily II)